jgi:hypothetical protein
MEQSQPTYSKFKTILSVVVALYALQVVFIIYPEYNLEGSWIMACNYAFARGLVFGRDFIFTYGPLGFLSTRNPQFVSIGWFLIADLFMVGGVFWFVRRYVISGPTSFLIAFCSVFFLRSSNYSQVMFVLFIIYNLVNIKNNCRSYFGLWYAAASGVLLFFIKLNYGLVSLFFMGITALLLVRRPRLLAAYAGVLIVVFPLLCYLLHVDFFAYISNGIREITPFDEAGYRRIDPHTREFCSAVVLGFVCLAFAVRHLWLCVKQRRVHQLLYGMTIALAYLLMYKNGFTRSDDQHHIYFFSGIPLFFLAIAMLEEHITNAAAKLLVVAVIIITGANMSLMQIDNDPHRVIPYLKAYLSPGLYLSGVFHSSPPSYPRALPPDVRARLGNATTDVLDWQSDLLAGDSINYDPRPLCQSFMAYTHELDSINAAHFFREDRPRYILAQKFSIDSRYYFWDESYTSALIHLNYDYDRAFSTDGSDPFKTSKAENFIPRTDYLLLSEKNGVHRYPIFQLIETRAVKITDTVDLHLPDTAAIYMTADIEYDWKGRLRRMCYQVPAITVTLFYEDTVQQYRAVVPILKSPVLINKAVIDATDLKNFYTGNLARNRTIKAFVFTPVTSGFIPEYKLSFYRMINY